ncbi:MAG: Lrp/AsnC family transcriptional regulator [Candidatus Bathyarchaeia archaeon]
MESACEIDLGYTASRILKKTWLFIDDPALTRLLAFVDIFVESPHMDEVVESLQKLPNMEELYEVTGEFDIVSLVSAEDIEEFRDILKNRIMKIRGIKSTVTSVVLHSHKGPRYAENGKSASMATSKLSAHTTVR